MDYTQYRSRGALTAGVRRKIVVTQKANEKQTHHRDQIHILETLHGVCDEGSGLCTQHAIVTYEAGCRFGVERT